ncbi:MAG TPA: carboxymuconolactone decarboxylase family protein [Pirellulales bacterium]|jgi:AhpD family alkylhydroperoxidase|nr:carboxymuconolactone decarboxylase family protein [Pirellulales bacterium]
MIQYDMANLKKIKKMAELAPAAMKAYQALGEAATADGAIPAKYKELIAVAVAMTTQCPYCIEYHSAKAKKIGATEQEIVEAVLVSAALRAGASVTHGTHAID